jgi:SAM-dependent methyltransferase
MTQNIYDNEEFFAAYSRLQRSVEGLGGAPEWPTFACPAAGPARVQGPDLGCGFGWFCRWARQQGAAQILGIDVSERMLARGRAATADPAITYTTADMEQLDLPADAFDLVYSSLALHYVENLSGLMSQAYRSLVPDGALVFAVEHPIFTAPAHPGWADERQRPPLLLVATTRQV